MSLNNILLIPGLDWTPRNLFRPGDNGLWQDMSNFGTLRQLSTGSTLVSSVGDPIGYIADSGPRGHLTTQTTNGKRPILSRTPEGGVRQLAVQSEAVGSTGWSGFGVDSTRIGNAITLTSDEGFAYFSQQSSITGVQVTVSFDLTCNQTISNVPVRAASTEAPVNGVAQLVSFVAGETKRLSFTLSSMSVGVNQGFSIGIDARSVIVPGGSNEFGYTCTFNRVQLELGDTATTYQKATTRYDITEAGKRDCWAYGTDGIDDAMSTPSSVDMSGSNEMTVCVGLRKLSDAATGIVGELSAIASNPGTFVSSAPSSVGANSYRFSSTGTSSASAGTGVFAAAPDSAVILGESKISTDVCKISRNGTLVESVSDDQGTGNYGDYRIYFDARAETSLFFQGLVYQRVIINRLLSDYEKTKLQQFVARKMGITL